MPKPTLRGRLRSALSVLVGPSWAGKLTGFLGGYNATDPRRKIIDPQVALSRGKTTANQLLNGNLSQLRSYCRDLERNNPTARACVEGLSALVVGSGIGLEPDTGDEALDERISEFFKEWCSHCGSNGESIEYLMHLGFREVVVAGESLWRIVYDE